MNKWKETTLGEIATIKGGKRLPLGSSLQREKNSHPYIKISNISNNQIGIIDEYVPDDVYESIRRYIVDSGNVILSIVGTIGLVAKIPVSLHCANLTENCVKILPDKNILDNNFLYYFLISRIGQSEIASNTVGAVQAKLPLYGVQNIKLLLPSVSKQKEIAAVLSSLDNKIELLQKQNETLEKIAQTIFKEWFVNFKIDGKKLKLENGIPEGWSVVSLSDVADITIGRTPPRKEDEWFSLDKKDFKWISIKDMGNCGVYIGETSEYLTHGAVKKFNIPIIPKNTVVLSFKMTVGRVSITLEEMLSNEAIAHMKLRESGIKSEYLYLFLKNFNFSNLGSTSSIVDATNSTTIKKIKILIPDAKSITDFDFAIRSTFEKILNNSNEIKTLSRLRDTLLSKLMNRELEILK